MGVGSTLVPRKEASANGRAARSRPCRKSTGTPPIASGEASCRGRYWATERYPVESVLRPEFVDTPSQWENASDSFPPRGEGYPVPRIAARRPSGSPPGTPSPRALRGCGPRARPPVSSCNPSVLHADPFGHGGREPRQVFGSSTIGAQGLRFKHASGVVFATTAYG